MPAGSGAPVDRAVYDQPMGTGSAPLRRAVLLVAAAFAVHQLRFVLAYGSDAHRVLNEPGHRYLPFAAGAAVVLLLVGALQFAGLLLRCARGSTAPERPAPALSRVWAQNAAVLVAVYVAQEGLEGAFTAGHPIWAHGGWIVLPLALAFGGIVAVLLVGAHRALAEVARRGRASSEPQAAEPRCPRPRSPALPPLHALARHLAGRAPPPARTAAPAIAGAALT